jgi:hypothetical protein
MSAVTDFAKADSWGKGESIIPLYEPFTNCSTQACVPYAFPAQGLTNIRDYGSIPMISWSSSTLHDPNAAGATDPNFTLKDVIDGDYDTYITAWARAAKAWDHPFFLRFDWEMNGNWFVWGNHTNGNTARQFVEAWRHVHDIFTRVGATNATWVWCPNDGEQDNKHENLAQYYPGNAYVNWTCMDVYNSGTTHGGRWETWNQLAEASYNEITREIAPTKPMMIGEFNSNSAGGSQAQWLSQTLSDIRNWYGKIHAVILYDTGDGEAQFALEDSVASRIAFANSIARPVYATNAYRYLSGTAIKAP